MSDINEAIEQLGRFDELFNPDTSRRASIETLPDGDYDFQIVESRFDLTPKEKDLILRVGLKVLGGLQAGSVVERAYWLTTEQPINILGTDLCMLGFDADQWKPANGRSFKKELKATVEDGRLVGLRFRGQKKTKVDGAKTYHNLYINARLTNGVPPPASVGPPTSDAPTVSADDDEVPF